MFAGIFIRSGYRSPQEYATQGILIHALTPYQQADQTGGWQDVKAIIIHTLTWNTAASQLETSPYQCPESQLIITSWIRLDNREKLKKILKITDIKYYTDPMLVIHTYRLFGRNCVNLFEGDFSFVIYDPHKHECFAARDSLGVKPFYYYIDNQVFIFSSTAAIFHKLNHIDLQPNQAWMAKFLANSSASYTETGFDNIFKLPPANSLFLTKKNHKLHRYFEFKDESPIIYKRDKKNVDAYREALEKAVNDRLNSAYLIGSETSGGIDSSTITALAALNLPHDKKHFHVFGIAAEKEEPNFILMTSQYHNIPHNHIYTHINPEESTESLFQREMKVLGYPSEQGNALGHLMFYKLCNQFGIRTLLSGYGGDEIVTNSGHLLIQELIHAHRYRNLYQTLQGSPFMRLLKMTKHLKNTWWQENHYQSHLEEVLRKQLPDVFIKKSAIDQYAVFDQRLKRSRYDKDYSTINTFILGNRISPSMPTRLDNGTLIASSYGIEYRWPLLDRRLIQQYLNSPAIEKYSSKATRYLHRRAVANILPNDVIWKNCKWMGGIAQSYANEKTGQNLQYLDILPEQLHPKLDTLVDRKKLLLLQKKLRAEKQNGNGGDIWRANALQALTKLNKWLFYTLDK